MTARWLEMITGPLEDKKRWRAYKKRVQQLPTGYRTAVEGVERYLMYTGPDGDSDQLLQMFRDPTGPEGIDGEVQVVVG